MVVGISQINLFPTGCIDKVLFMEWLFVDTANTLTNKKNVYFKSTVRSKVL